MNTLLRVARSRWSVHLVARWWPTLALVLLTSSAALAQRDWPQWRGEDGMAWSSQTLLPAEIGPDADTLRWQVHVPGAGISSPVVQNGRLFLTTAYEGEVGGSLRSIELTVTALAVGALLLLAARRRRGEEALTGLRRAVATLDRGAIALGTVGFAAGVLVLLYRSELLFPKGSPGYCWWWTSAVGLVGLGVALGWLGPGSYLRLIGALAIGGLAWWLFDHIPLNRYTERFALKVRIAMLIPGLALAVWSLLAFALARGAAPRGSALVRAVGALAIALGGAGQFYLLNYHAPAQGMVRALLCYDSQSGELLWNKPLFVAPLERKYDSNSYATPTPCTNGELVFADFGSGYACLDYDGNVRWQRVVEEYQEHTRYGASTSPVLLDDDKIVLLHDAESGRGDSYVQALDFATGELLWRAEHPENQDSYTTPLVVEREGGRQLVAGGYHRIVGYSLENGEELWSVPTRIGQIVPSIQHRGDLVIVSGGTHGSIETVALRLSGHGPETTVEKVWTSRRAVPAISSPVWLEDVLITITDGGIATCYDPETGDKHWQERLDGMFWPSLVADRDKVYAFTAEGLLYVLRGGPEFEVLHTSDFDSRTQATPTIAEGRLFVRTESELFSFGAAPE